MTKSYAYKERNKRRRKREKEENERLQRLRGIDEEERRGNVLLWDLIVNNDDICFKHILPKLNSTDVKFLYGVNTETRKLIKISSRADDLKKKFKIEEMSSISTLEFAWEHKSFWSRYLYDEPYFCFQVARTNKASCSSGRERRKSVGGIIGRLRRLQKKVIWKW